MGLGALVLGLVAWPMLIAAGVLAATGLFLWQRNRGTMASWALACLPASESPFRPRPAGWHPDPYGHAEQRYWNGRNWTDRVATDGVTTRSPV